MLHLYYLKLNIRLLFLLKITSLMNFFFTRNAFSLWITGVFLSLTKHNFEQTPKRLLQLNRRSEFTKMLSYYKFSSVYSLLLSIFRESDTTERLLFHFSLSYTGEGNGNPLQCSCLENLRVREVWWASIYGVAQSWTRLKRLSSSCSSKHLQKINCVFQFSI